MSNNRELSKLIPHILKNTDVSSGVMVRKNEQTMTANLTIQENENAMMVGPVTLAPNVQLTVDGNLSVV